MPGTDMLAREAFILENTSPLSPPHVPELRLRLAAEAHDLWHRTEEQLEAIGLPPPFWAFAWAGGQGLARHVLDHRALVGGKHVLDFACGSGLVGIAAMLGGASKTVCSDIDGFCGAAVRLNAGLNGVEVGFRNEDLIGVDEGWDVVLAGDVFYEKPLADALLPWFAALAGRGATVLVGDPGRAYLPKSGIEPLATYEVAVTRALEDAEVKRTTVWRFA